MEPNRDFEAELRDLISDVLRAHRSRHPETQDEIAGASQHLADVIDAIMPRLQELLVAGIDAVNHEGPS